jgi:hypothetical protein
VAKLGRILPALISIVACSGDDVRVNTLRDAGGTVVADGGLAPARRICDGSDEIRFGYWTPVSPRSVRPFTLVLYDLGNEFLYVDGHCHYWVDRPGLPNDEYRRWRSYREGVLTQSQEQSLHDAVSYDDFSKLPRCGPGALEGSPTVLWNGVETRMCQALAGVPDGWPARDELYAAGHVVSGGVRIVVGIDPVPDDAPLYAWPLSGLVEYEIPYAMANDWGQSSLISAPADVEALRTLRDRAIADATAEPGRFYGLIYLQAKGYAAVIRDDLPFTDRAHGLWVPK